MDADEMKAARARLGFTQAQLAAELGVHAMTVSKWETGQRSIPEPVARLVQRMIAERRTKRKS
jgi:DNA-binding transcriptional regulator YiaG